MKKLLQRIMLIFILAISTHQIQAAWYDPVVNTWNRFTNWVNSTWQGAYSWWYPTPGVTQEAIIGTTITAAQQAQLRQKAFNDAIDNFNTNLGLFRTTVGMTSFKTFGDLWADPENKAFLDELDSIKEFGMPKSIFDAAQALNKPDLIPKLRNAFAFLQPTITWNDLSEGNKIKLIQMQVSPETISNIKKHVVTLSKKGHNSGLNAYFRWLNAEEERINKGQALGKIIPALTKPNDTAMSNTYLPALRSYKVSHILEKLHEKEKELLETLYQIKSQS